MSYITRQVENQIRTSLENKNVLMLLGPRQVGKTTLAKRLLDEYHGDYFNMDVETHRKQLLDLAGIDPARITHYLKPGRLLIVDEAQRLPETGRIVKGWYDSEVAKKLVLLGSSSLDLLDRTAEPLTGRNEKVYLLPLSLKELVAHQTWYIPTMPVSDGLVRPVLYESVVRGGYPAVHAEEGSIAYLQSVTSDYLLKDVTTPGLIRDATTIKKLLLLLAYQIGNVVSVLELSRTLGVARMTVERYIDLLERCFIIFSVSAYSNNPRKEVSKSKKIYFWDTGIRNALIDQLGPVERPDIGFLWENWVISEFAKRTIYPLGVPLYFWRSRDGSEVDLISKDVRSGTMSAYEIKWSGGKATKAFTTSYHIPVSVINRENVLQTIFK